MTGDGTYGVFIPEGVVVGKLAEPMGRESDRTGWVESQQVVEGGGMYKCECGCEWECEWDHCCVLSGCLLLLSLCSSGFQGLLRLNLPSLLMLFGCISISVVPLMRRSV